MSPDGTKIAVSVIGPENLDVWIYDLVRDTLMRLTFDPGVELFPIWTPDGQRVAFGSQDGLRSSSECPTWMIHCARRNK